MAVAHSANSPGQRTFAQSVRLSRHCESGWNMTSPQLRTLQPETRISRLWHVNIPLASPQLGQSECLHLNLFRTLKVGEWLLDPSSPTARCLRHVAPRPKRRLTETTLRHCHARLSHRLHCRDGCVLYEGVLRCSGTAKSDWLFLLWAVFCWGGW